MLICFFFQSSIHNNLTIVALAFFVDDIEITTNWEETTTSFDAMDLKEDLLRGIYAYGFEKPSAIQQRAIKPILLKHDVIAQAQSGKFLFSLFYFVYLSGLINTR